MDTDFADVPLSYSRREAAENTAEVDIAGAAVQVAANESRNKDEAGESIHCSSSTCKAAEHRVATGRFEYAVDIAENKERRDSNPA